MQALVLDAMSRGFECVAITLGLPYVTISNALHPDLCGDTPIWIFDWMPETGIEGRTRNVEGLRAFNEFTRPIKALQMEYLDGAGVAVDWSDPYALYSHRRGSRSVRNSSISRMTTGLTIFITRARFTTVRGALRTTSRGNSSRVSR